MLTSSCYRPSAAVVGYALQTSCGTCNAGRRERRRPPQTAAGRSRTVFLAIYQSECRLLLTYHYYNVGT